MSNLHMAVLYYDDGSAQPLLGRKSVRDFYMRALPQDEEYHWDCFHSQVLGAEQKIQLREKSAIILGVLWKLFLCGLKSFVLPSALLLSSI